MSTLRFLIVFVCVVVPCSEIAAQQRSIATEPYQAETDELTGDVLIWGQMIVHRDFDVELEERIRSVPLFAIQYGGLHHLKGRGRGSIEARAKCISERLEVALHLLGKGGKLHKAVDDWKNWRLTGSFAPPYPAAPATHPAIYISHPELGNGPLRIMTVYPEDAERFPGVESSRDKLCNYLMAVIEAHRLLFYSNANSIGQYEELEIDLTREGKIFKEIFIRSDEVRNLQGAETITNETIKDSLARIAMPQRQRLVNMALRAPRDWKDRYEQ